MPTLYFPMGHHNTTLTKNDKATLIFFGVIDSDVICCKGMSIPLSFATLLKTKSSSVKQFKDRNYRNGGSLKAKYRPER